MVHNVAKMKRPLITVQLIHIHGPMKGEIQEFSKDTVIIGRHPSSDLCFPPDLTIVSRKHAEIVREGNQFKLINQGANGTFVNGKRVSEVLLKDGDVLEFADGGPKVSFLTQMAEDSDIQPLAPPAPQKTVVAGPPVKTQVAKTPEIPQTEREPSEEAVYVQPVPEPAKFSPPAPPVSVDAPSTPVQPPLGAIPRAAAPLIIQYGPTIRSYKELPVTLGRHVGCGFVLDHPGILDQHAQVFYVAGQYWIKDLTGQKMVQVNGQPIPFQAPLALDDMVTLGPKGPAFRFMGEGRLAEIAEAPSERQSIPDTGKEHRGSGTKPNGTEGKDSKGIFSRLKKKLF